MYALAFAVACLPPIVFVAIVFASGRFVVDGEYRQW